MAKEFDVGSYLIAYTKREKEKSEERTRFQNIATSHGTDESTRV